MEIIFKNPTYIWFLLSIPLLVISHFVTLSKVRGKVLQFANFAAIARITGMQPQQSNLLILFERISILVFIVLAVSGTVVSYIGESGESDYVLAIDASSSMLANDLTPTRIDAAKEAALLFIDSLPPKSRIALITFAGTSFVKQTLSDNTKESKKTLEDIGIEPISGTDIGDAITTATNMLLTSEKGRAIVLLTDGRSNVGMNPLQTIGYANKNNINVYTIGIGTEEGGTPHGINVTLTLDEETLEIIANQTGGKYYRAKSKEELTNAYKEIAYTSKRKLSIDLTPYLMLMVLLVVFLDWGLVSTKYRRIP